MSHCISVFLIRKEELRDNKIESILGDKTLEIKFKELEGNILAITNIPNIKEFGINKTIAKIETDYFGGSGNQSAKLFVNNKKVYDKSDEQDYLSRPINDVLREMGVKRTSSKDEFDTIGLGNYRENKDFE